MIYGSTDVLLRTPEGRIRMTLAADARLVIHNADYVVTVDGERRILQDASVVIRGRRIERVVKARDVTDAELRGRVIDAAGKIVAPGLIDTHIHTTKQLNRGLADEVELRDHLLERQFPFEAEMDEDDAYWSSLACMLELIRSGTTCFIEAGNHYPDATGRAVEESGMRGIVARTASDMEKSAQGSLPERLFREHTDDILAKSTATVERWNGAADGRIRAWFQVRITYLGSDRLCRDMKQLADRQGVGFEAHCTTSLENRQTVYRQFGESELRRLERLDALGPNVMLVHMGWVEDADLHLLVDHDLKISHCPGSSLHASMGSIINGKIPTYLALGVSVGLGSDSAGSNNSLDMFRNMYLEGTHKEVHHDARLVPAETVLEMATRTGARVALWDDEIGSLEPGKRADLILIDADRPEMQPVHNPVSNLVYSANGACVDTTIVDGRVLMEGRRVLTLDAPRILAEARLRVPEIVRRAGMEAFARPRWPIE
jgi:5-methylthioadenosine/S-adenosylhomocysteine deaminase